MKTHGQQLFTTLNNWFEQNSLVATCEITEGNALVGIDSPYKIKVVDFKETAVLHKN